MNEIVETLDGDRRYKFEWRVWSSVEAERLLDQRPRFDAELVDLTELSGLRSSLSIPCVPRST